MILLFLCQEHFGYSVNCSHCLKEKLLVAAYTYIRQIQNFKLFFEYFREVRKGNLQGQPETIADCENFVPSYFLHQATNLHILD